MSYHTFIQYIFMLSTDVPYIANWIYEHPGLDLNLKGIWIADPSLSYGVVQEEIPALRFVQVTQLNF
jgi:carboxypeptidase D